MRLFVAAEISHDSAAAVLELIARLRSTAATLAPRSRITWTTADRLHVTIRFIGHVDDERSDAIRAALALPLAVEPFDMTIAGVGTFPPRGAARVVWAGLTMGRDRLMAIEGMLSERLTRIGVPREERPYSPHLTLARVRDAAGLRSAALVDHVRDMTLGTIRVDAITLFESRLSPKGPTYVALQRTALTTGTEDRHSDRH
jgi:2'-5' RNA ligase